MHKLAQFSLVLLGFSFSTGLTHARELTLEQRVQAQEAIEKVYWSHRLWPTENRQPKPGMLDVMSRDEIRSKVRSYLSKSEALGERWHRPITIDQLEAEVQRMRRNSRNRQTLDELFTALGRDPFLILECLARPALAERLFANWTSKETTSDPARTAHVTNSGGRFNPSLTHLTSLNEEVQPRLEAEGQGPPTLVRGLQPGYEAPIEQSSSQPTEALGADSVTPDTLSVASVTSCTQGTWSSMPFGVADSRTEHVSVWTGSEMIVWGGHPGISSGRYDPATDTWTPMSKGPGVTLVKAIWTGTEMIVWGVTQGSVPILAGGRYNPRTDTWATMATTNQPPARVHHSMIWTGTEVIVWGGEEAGSSGRLRTGGRYNPSTDTWIRTSLINAPFERSNHTAVWTGTKMIVWGGRDSSGPPFDTGGIYDPSTDTWTETGSVGRLLSPREHAVSVWTGSEMLIWGGVNGSYYPNDIGSYDPLTRYWSPIGSADGPSGAIDATAIWTGNEMIVWGGRASRWASGTAGRYNRQDNVWRPVSTISSPAARFLHTAVWTGHEMIVWGGQTYDSDGYELDTGGRYDPSTDSWVPTSTGVVEPRSDHAAVWTGSEMIVWGGGGLSSGGIYDPATDEWRPTSTVGAPRALWIQGIWTGKEMIVWGGFVDGWSVNTGGRYNPSTNTWLPTRVDASTPSARTYHSTLWTGKRMIVWGGGGGSMWSPTSATSTGGQYDPQTDTWTPTSTISAPQARRAHSAVMLNGKMVVWGGATRLNPYVAVNTGGVYDPLANTWTTVSLVNAPVARASHYALPMSNDEMIIWGGSYGYQMNTGGRYKLSSDEWSPIAAGPALPSLAEGFSTVWTGKELILWGVASGRYSPETDTWAPMPIGPGAPDPRKSHTAVWTGSEMIIWGGTPLTSTGGRYCACPSGRMTYRDLDADGFGDASLSMPSCDGLPQLGYVLNASDCDDADATVQPNGIELCNGKDDDCDSTVDNAGQVTDLSVERTSFFPVGNEVVLRWSPVAGAEGYDVISGSLAELMKSGGAFDASVDTCMADDSAASQISDARCPVPGEGYFYLIRAVGCQAAGTYDEPGRVRSRDSGILESASACR